MRSLQAPRTPARRQLGPRATRAALAVIVIGAAALALAWSWYLPMFEAPDEPSHFQYAAAIYAAGGLLRAGADPGSYRVPRGRVVPDPAYLESASAVAVITEHRQVKAPAGYGSAAYYGELDSSFRLQESQRELFSPTLLRYYPFGYYALDAAFMGLLLPLQQSPTGLFFAARSLSPLLLVLTLLFTFGLCRELGISRPRSLLFTALVGFFPMSTFVAAAVQPDNLSAALVAASLYSALRLRREPGSGRWTALVGAALGMLTVTKYQYALATALPILAMLFGQRLNRRRRQSALGPVPELALLVGPAAALLVIQLWVSWGAAPVVGAGDFGRNAEYRQALAAGPTGVATEIVRVAGWVVSDYLLPNRTVITFWGTWADAPIIFGSLDNTIRVWLLISAFSFVTAGLALWWLGRTGIRLIRLIVRGRAGRALEVAGSNPVVNAYLVFSAVMIVSGSDQGRYWFPYLLAVFLVAAHYAPRVLPRRGLRLAASRLTLGGLVAFTAFGSLFALPSIGDRYYGHGRGLTGLSEQRLEPVGRPGDYLAVIVYPQANLSIWRPQVQQMAVIGWAIDREAARPARTVFVSVDGGPGQEAVYGDDSPELAGLGAGYGRAGFDAIIDTGGLRPGWHELTVSVVSADGRRLYAPGPPQLFELPCHLSSVGACVAPPHHLPE